jgi:hypothetical protein
MNANDAHTPNNNLIRDLDQLIQQRGAQIDESELYSIVMGIAVYRLQHVIGVEATADLLEGMIQGLHLIPKPRLNSMH